MNRKPNASKKSRASHMLTGPDGEPSARLDAATSARLDEITLELIESMHKNIPHLAEYHVNCCPQCGENFTTIREAIEGRFAAQGRPVTFPPHICLNCGLDRRRVTIGPELATTDTPEP